jgi:hypothetical protein
MEQWWTMSSLTAKLEALANAPSATEGERSVARAKLQALEAAQGLTPGDLSLSDILNVDDSEYGEREYEFMERVLSEAR